MSDTVIDARVKGPTIDDLGAWRPEEIPEIAGILAMKRHWSGNLFLKVRDEYEAATRGMGPLDHATARPIVEGLRTLRYMLWYDRFCQDRMWQTVGRIVGSRMDEWAKAIEPRPDDLGTLETVGDFTYPGYYETLDFHRQDGGVWRDIRGAVVYMLGARLVHVGRNDRFELHDHIARAIEMPTPPKRILDVGCGFGKNAFSLKARWPDAEVHGIDLAAPCLALARRMATERNLTIHWRQADAELLPDPSDGYDLITIAMVMHELPKPAIDNVLREALRVLRPGGRLVMLENRYIGDPLRDWVLAWHSDLIAEPYWRPWRDLDPAAECRAAGFAEARTEKWYTPHFTPAMEADPRKWFIPWGMTTAVKG
jgi:SAM-dependent methyltransferase